MILPKKGEFTFPIADGRINLLGGAQDLRTSTLIRHRPIQGESDIDFLGEPDGSLPQPHDSFPDAGEAVNDFRSMSGNLIYFHHIEPRVKLYSPRDESFPIPLKIHWRDQNYSYELGCQAREAHWWLLEHWWLSRLVWSLDRFHTTYYIGRKTSRRIYVVRGEFQVRSFMAKTLEVNGKARQAKVEAKVVEWKAPSWERTKIAWNLFHRPRGYGIQGNHQNARKKLGTSVTPAMPCKIMKKKCGSGASNKIKTRLACILEADESTRLRMGNWLPNHHEDHIVGKGDN